MESVLDNTNVDINLMLINWGLLNGRYEDGVIKTTKQGIINRWFAFTLFTFLSIKYTLLMFIKEESEMAIYLGEFMQYFGPKIFVDFIAAVVCENSAILIMLFYMASKSADKMLFWLDHMEYDNETRCFYKLNLTISDSKRFTKRFALLWFIIKPVVHFLGFITFITILASFFLFRNNDHFYYLISIFVYSLGVWCFAYNWCVLTLVLYQVKVWLIKFN